MMSIEDQEIDVSPIWQRKVVWNNKMKRDLMDTLLVKRHPINPIVLWEITPTRFACVDGKNRLYAVLSFMKNEFGVKVNGGEVFYNDLDDTQKKRFGMINIEVRILFGESWTEETVRDYFQSIQGGAKLNWEERINSYDNVFVDLTRELVMRTEDDFKNVLGKSCNDRFELYTYIANIISVHPIISNIFKSQNNGIDKTANTNKLFMDYVIKFDNIMNMIQETDIVILENFVKNVVKVITTLKEMQDSEISQEYISIWVPEVSNVKPNAKPSKRDFVSVAFYMRQNPMQNLDVVIFNLKRIYRALIIAALGNTHADVLKTYYYDYCKSQKQYYWNSVEKRYEIMIQFLLNA